MKSFVRLITHSYFQGTDILTKVRTSFVYFNEFINSIFEQYGLQILEIGEFILGPRTILLETLAQVGCSDDEYVKQREIARICTLATTFNRNLSTYNRYAF